MSAGEIYLDKASFLSFDDGIPSLKQKFKNERHHAKVINFSMVYGITPMGLSKQLEVSKDDAKKLMSKWYDDRTEVRSWQTIQVLNSLSNGRTCEYHVGKEKISF